MENSVKSRPKRLFIGGIPSNTTKEDLKEFFSTYGTVKDITTISGKTGLSNQYG